MKKPLLSALFLGLLARAALAQDYSIDWYKVAGGGGTSSGGSFSLSGTVGQADAASPLTGGSFSLTGGFWSLESVVQTAGLPLLTITQSDNHVIISWDNTGTYTLQQNNDLASSAGWSAGGYTVNTSNGTNSVTLTPTASALFFRLAAP